MTALPTTATAKAKTTKRRKPTADQPTTDQASAGGFTIPRERYMRFPPTILPDVPELEISTELLDHFRDMGMTREQIRTVAGSWLVTQAELTVWEARLNEGTVTPATADLETAKLAAQMEACILHHGQPSTPAILDATPEQLLEFIDFYETELDATYPRLDSEDGPARFEALEKWRRLNGYLWECKARAGLTPATFRVLAQQDLDAKLQGVDQ